MEALLVLLVIIGFIVAVVSGYFGMTTSRAHERLTAQAPSISASRLTDAPDPRLLAPDSSPYVELGVTPEASADELRRAYRQRARERHPDLNPHLDDEPFKRLQAAWERIQNGEVGTLPQGLEHAVEEALGRRDWPAARDLLRQLLAVRQEPDVYLALVQVHVEMGDEELAADYLFVSRQHHPRDPLLTAVWTRYLLQVGQAERAFRVARDVYNAVKGTASVVEIDALGGALLEAALARSRPKTAVELASRLLEIHPDDPDLHYARAVAGALCHKLDPATASALRLIDLAPAELGPGVVMLALQVAVAAHRAGDRRNALRLAGAAYERAQFVGSEALRTASQVLETARRKHAIQREVQLPPLSLSVLAPPDMAHRAVSAKQQAESQLAGLCYQVGEKALARSDLSAALSTRVETARAELTRLEAEVGELERRLSTIANRRRPTGFLNRVIDTAQAFADSTNLKAQRKERQDRHAECQRELGMHLLSARSGAFESQEVRYGRLFDLLWPKAG